MDIEKVNVEIDSLNDYISILSDGIIEGVKPN